MPHAGPWIPNTTASKWVWQLASGQPTNVLRTFRLLFDLTGLDPLTSVDFRYLGH